ncbi:hypothetical protein K490DRAFT_53582 [Saccharata proteae CBS 121410]|uniref:Uncharacterized protein n=1 Tax=Saccharata proteae CBS 121410 TaxID=1314787 RepID=A0A9P4LXH4_9PEZI|nr:hypothetical protein K490DRAFT_53582 [Saccharata proteae CBS 121410]
MALAGAFKIEPGSNMYFIPANLYVPIAVTRHANSFAHESREHIAIASPVPPSEMPSSFLAPKSWWFSGKHPKLKWPQFHFMPSIFGSESVSVTGEWDDGVPSAWPRPRTTGPHNWSGVQRVEHWIDDVYTALELEDRSM